MREVRGVRGIARVIQATRGRSRRWPGAWPRPAVARARTCLGEGEKTTEEEAGWAGLLGRAVPGQHRSWAAGRSR